MKKPNGLYTGMSESASVDEFLQNLDHPLIELIHQLRKTILSVDKKIGEGIYWNAPTFYFTGPLPDFDPKEYKRYIVGFNFFKKDALRLIFLKGADLHDPTGLLEGDYKDGRRLITFTSIDDLKAKEKAFKQLIKSWIKLFS